MTGGEDTSEDFLEELNLLASEKAKEKQKLL